MKVLWWIVLVLTVVGALNWGLVGLFEFDLVAYLFSDMMTVAKVVYVLVGVSGLLTLILSVMHGKKCNAEM
ncbi:DUF378 domain-containing protein [Candidatus Peregrinibacteria bacterium]|nr:DUF378 domain-containing protein [Candidatus Peregrinibacteria bacterium]